MITTTQEGGFATCEICGNIGHVRTRSENLRYIRRLFRKLGWKTCYIDKHWGTHDHCSHCVAANTNVVGS